MSRHRFVRNLTEDDYYDDYDDDDYYDEEGDYYEEQEGDYVQEQQEQEQCKYGKYGKYSHSHSQQQQEQQRQITTSRQQTTSTTQSNSSTSGNAPLSNEQESIRLVMGIGFGKEQATKALQATNGDVQHAVNHLLMGSVSDHDVQNKTKTVKTKGWGKPASDSYITASVSKAPSSWAKQSGIQKPPAGFGGPPPKTTSSSSVAGIQKPPAGFGGLPASSNLTGTLAPAPSPKRKNKPSATGSFSTNLYDSYQSNLSPSSLQELKAQKSRLAMVVMGHVDAGKSTLMGQVLLQSGQVTQRTVNKYQKQASEVNKSSFALAWILDEDETEREKGVTMDVATKFVSTPQHDFTLLDSPGHADFVPSLLTGTAAADVGLMVVPATPSEYKASLENSIPHHLILARGLGLHQVIVVINKLDSMDWNQGRFEEIQGRLKPMLQQHGFGAKKTKYVPLSGLQGINVWATPPNGHALSQWYKGPCLLDAMDALSPAQRQYDRPLRVLINDVFSEGKGVTVRGRVVQGIARVGDRLVVSPVGDETIVYKLEEQRHDGNYAMAGDTVLMGLSGIDVVRLAMGGILSHTTWRPPLVKKVQAKLYVLPKLIVPILQGTQAVWHMHSMDLPIHVTRLLSSSATKKKKRVRALNGGVNAVVEITLSERVCLERYADCRAMGRFVLRRGGDTIAIGLIEELLA